MDRDEWERKMACCSSDPKCSYCPLRPENADKTVKELFKDVWR